MHNFWIRSRNKGRLGNRVGWACLLNENHFKLEDAYRYPLFNPTVDRETGFHTKAVLCIPILGYQGNVIACAQFLNKIEYKKSPASENTTNLCNLKTDKEEVQKIDARYFDLKDLAKAKEMLGELLYAYALCPWTVFLRMSIAPFISEAHI